jgi:acylphosphatase
MSVRVHLVVRGRVQGVWFRGAMQEEAQRHQLSGWVRNRSDGSVEAEAEGERAAVDALIVWAHEGPPAARVTEVTVERIPARADLREGFAVTR